ncbi:MAG: hypothetical protein Q6358_13660 [Candidatus Brocadiales bacterium]|nr:hypothetical protein [Candidatus Brocadiales bacterium]
MGNEERMAKLEEKIEKIYEIVKPYDDERRTSKELETIRNISNFLHDREKKSKLCYENAIEISVETGGISDIGEAKKYVRSYLKELEKEFYYNYHGLLSKHGLFIEYMKSYGYFLEQIYISFQKIDARFESVCYSEVR